MSFSSFTQIVSVSAVEEKPFWQVVMEDSCHEQNISPEKCFSTMKAMYQAMWETDRAYDGSLCSASGLTGGDGEKLRQYRQTQGSLLGDYLSLVAEKAVKMAESNACMKRIVAAPTAGSCGVIPAVLLAYRELKTTPEDEMIKALFTAAGIGEVYAHSACIAGAEGGCQAEIGVASSMAAGAVSFLEGGYEEEIVHAAALAMKNMLGLSCDPVAGLVEVPCVKRNAFGAVNAVTAAQMVLSGIRSVIPPDEVVDAMRRTGKLLPPCLRETSQDGLAATSTALKIAKNMKVKE